MTAALLATIGVFAAATAWSTARRWSTAARTARRAGLITRRTRRVPALVARSIHDAGLDSDPVDLFHGWLGALGLALAVAAVIPAGAIVLAAVAVGPPVALVANRGRARRRRTAQLPVALDTVAASVRGGTSLHGALRDAASIGPPVGPELAELARRAEAGMSLPDVVAEWSDEPGQPAARLAGASLVVAATLGGPGADALEGAAASLRERAAMDAEAAALAVQARMSATVLTAAPVVFALLLTSVDPASGRFLLATPAGLACLAAGGALDAAGAVWMARIVRAAR